MRVVLQRVTRASVEVGEKIIGTIGAGLLVLLGVAQTDTEKDADWLVEKILKLRLFSGGEESGFEKNIVEIGGSLLIVSQFTLYGDCKKGTRPSFSSAARPEQAEKLYEYFLEKCVDAGIQTESGQFGANMEVDLVNDGPVTMTIDSNHI